MKFALLLLSSLLAAQTPRATEAWAIYNSSSLPKPQQQQFLLEQLKALEPDSQTQYGSPEHALLLLTFDALIQSNIEVPATALEPYAQRWPAQVALLLTSSKDPKSLLWKLRKNTDDRPFNVHIHNLLVRHDPQRLHDTLLNEMLIRHRFIVLGESVQTPQFGAPGSHGDGFSKDFPGFPPIHDYDISLAPKPGWTVLSSDAQTVFYRRITGTKAGGDYRSRITPEEDRLPVLAKLLDLPLAQLTAYWDRTTTIPWTTPQAFQKQANALLQAQAAEIQNLFRNIRPRPNTPYTQRFSIQTEVLDYRRNPAPGLPPLPSIPAKTFFLFP